MARKPIYSGARLSGVPVTADDGSVVYQVETVGAGGTSSQPTVISEGASNKTDYSMTASTESTQAVPANAARKKLFFQNLDAAINVHANFGAAATTGTGSLRISPGASLELTGTSQAVNVVAASGAPFVTIWEF